MTELLEGYKEYADWVEELGGLGKFVRIGASSAHVRAK
jgi:hypothetical protein